MSALGHYRMIASMWLGNLMLIIINLPVVGVWVSAAARTLSAALSLHHRVLLYRHLFDQQLAGSWRWSY
jgi:hypothetical protein